MNQRKKKEMVMYHYRRLFERYPTLVCVKQQIMDAYEIMMKVYQNNGKLLVCGNGGSAADSDHIVGELMKGFYKQRPLSVEEKEQIGEKGAYLQGALPAISLTQHTALSTAFLNDVVGDMIFAQQVHGLGNSQDVFLGISASGNAENVRNAALVAKVKGLKVITLTGNTGGKLKELSDVCITAPSEIIADIQELHLPIYHTLCAMLEEEFFD